MGSFTSRETELRCNSGAKIDSENIGDFRKAMDNAVVRINDRHGKV
jgi:hypothetical protein